MIGFSPWRAVPFTVLAILAASTWLSARSESALGQRFDGLNVIAVAGHPFGSTSAKQSLADAKKLGANAIAIIPFLWQSNPSSPDLIRGEDMPDAELRAAIRDAEAVGLTVMVKPHVWVPGSWAGAIAMSSETNWQEWFANYRRELNHIAQIAEEEKASALAIGTELLGTTQRPEWDALVTDARLIFSGRLLYVAHNIEEADRISFWKRLDIIGVTLYPSLGADEDRRGRRKIMNAVVDRLDALAVRTGKPIVIAEIGLRSAQGAPAKPWESAEERVALPDPMLQAEVLDDWLNALDRPSIRGVLIWRWLTDPHAGGPADTDFTVQGKPAEHVLKCVWTKNCEPRNFTLR